MKPAPWSTITIEAISVLTFTIITIIHSNLDLQVISSPHPTVWASNKYRCLWGIARFHGCNGNVRTRPRKRRSRTRGQKRRVARQAPHESCANGWSKYVHALFINIVVCIIYFHYGMYFYSTWLFMIIAIKISIFIDHDDLLWLFIVIVIADQ